MWGHGRSIYGHGLSNIIKGLGGRGRVVPSAPQKLTSLSHFLTPCTNTVMSSHDPQLSAKLAPLSGSAAEGDITQINVSTNAMYNVLYIGCCFIRTTVKVLATVPKNHSQSDFVLVIGVEKIALNVGWCLFDI